MMVVALQRGVITSSVSMCGTGMGGVGGMGGDTRCRAGPLNRYAGFSHVRDNVTYGSFRCLGRRALCRASAHDGDVGRGAVAMSPLAGLGVKLSSVTSALALSAALTLLPVLSRPDIAMAGTSTSPMPGSLTDQELQYQEYQRQYQQYQQQQSAYEQMQAKAQPFQKVEVNKGRIWLLFVLGASSLFGVTVVVENNGSWFPAIARANKAMKASMKAIEERERLQKMGMLNDVEAEVVSGVSGIGGGVEAEVAPSAPVSTQDAVLAGLREASANAKETMKSLKEGRSGATMIPLELSAGDDEEEIAVDVVDMQAGRQTEEDEEEYDDIGSLLDEPIPGLDDDDDEEEVVENDDKGNGTTNAGEQPDGSAAAAQATSQADIRKPLFEISGDDIDASITNRAEQFKEELERSPSNGSVAGNGDAGVDLSNISLEDLQKELEKRNQP